MVKCLHRLYRKKHEKVLSETTMPRALIIGMKHHLVNLYQVCSNYIPASKNGPPRGSHVLHRLYRGKHEKIFLSESIWFRALIFGMWHHLVDLYHVCSNYAPGAKNGPPRGHMFYIYRLRKMGETWKNILV